MRSWVWSVIPMVLVGCVSSADYERVRTQYKHLKEVKTEWETEKDDLNQRVDAVQRAYSNVSTDQGALRLQQEQAKMEVARVRDDSRVLTGKIALRDAQLTALDQKFSKVLDQLSMLAETNVRLTSRVESLIGKLGALTARMKPVGSQEAKGRASEIRKPAAAQVGEHRVEDVPRGTLSILGTNAPAPYDSGEKDQAGPMAASPAVEKAMGQRGIKGRAPVARNDGGKATAPVKNYQVHDASKISLGNIDATGPQSGGDLPSSAAKDQGLSKLQKETDAVLKHVGAPNAGATPKSGSAPASAHSSTTGAPGDAFAAPPSGALTFSGPQPAGSVGKPEGEKHADGTQE